MQKKRLTDIGLLADFIGAETITEHSVVEPERIAIQQTITFSYGDYGDSFDGMLEHKSGRFHIYCNQNQRNSTRERFTFAHELGHFFIDDHRNALTAGLNPHPSQTSYSSNNLIEHEADHFAAHLLMPTLLVKKIIKNRKPSAAAIMDIHNKLKVSRTAAALRLLDYTNSIFVLMKWSSAGLQWRRFSDSAYRNGFRTTIENLSVNNKDSLTLDAIGGKHILNEKRPTMTYCWFPWIGQGSEKDEIWNEEILDIGKYGVLTLLSPKM